MDKIFTGLFNKEPNEIIENDFYYGSDSEGDQFDEVDEELWLKQGFFKNNWEGKRQNRSESYKLCDAVCEKIAAEGKPFMEIACGPGMGLTPKILSKNPKIPCLATDACSRLIKAWRRYINSNLTEYNIDLASFSAMNIPIKDASFDYVTSFIGISSTRNGETGQLRALKEIYRILKPGGYFITVENEWTDLSKIDEVFKLWGRYNYFGTEKRMSWHDKFASAGFLIESNDNDNDNCYFRKLEKDDNELGEAAERFNIEIGMRFCLYILHKGT
jgi:ubiquinone/menaquinone biosynthesis C-methylase UbiE